MIKKWKKICLFKQNELDKWTEASKIRYRLNLLLENADYQKKNNSHVPEDLQYLFQGKLADNGTTKLSRIETAVDSLPNYDSELLSQKKTYY